MHPHQITDAGAAREFALAGDARLTLVSRKTGTRFTYRVEAAPAVPGKSPSPASHFVAVLTGADNDYAYTFMAWRARDTGEWRQSMKSRVGQDAPSWRAWRWFADRVLSDRDGDMPKQLEVWHEGRCAVCNRVLTTPESLKRGIGPECAGKMGIAA